MTLKRRSGLLGAVALATVASSTIVSAQAPRPQQSPVQFDRDLILEKMDLREFDIQSFVMPAVGGRPVRAPVFLDGKEYEIDVERYLITTVNVEFWDEYEDGTRVRDLDPPRCVTYKGNLVDPVTQDIVGHVRASIDERMIWSMIWHDNGNTYGIQPAADVLKGFDPTVHVIYNLKNVITAEEKGFMCGNSLLPNMTMPQDIVKQDRDPDGQQRAAGDDIIEIAFDNGYEWFQFNGSKKATVREAQKILNNTNGMYEVSGLDRTFLISFFQNRLGGPGPYTSTDSGTLLNATTSQWETGNRSVAQRDTVNHLTGIPMNGGFVLGVAWFQNVCPGGGLLSGYGVCYVTWTSNNASQGALVAHEVGHNLGASHCDGDADCGTMCSGFGGCSGNVTTFGSRSITDMNNFLSTKGCLHGDIADITGSFFTDFESGLDATIWQENDGANVGSGGLNEPSGTESLVLNADGPTRWERDYVSTAEIHNLGTTASSISFWYEVKGGAIADRAFTVRMLSAGNNRRFQFGYDHDGVNQSVYTFVNSPLPYPQANHDKMTIYFESGPACTGPGTGTVFIDDFTFTMTFARMGFQPAPGPSGRSVLSLFQAQPFQKVHFFANLAGQAMSADNTQIYSIGSAVANASGVAQLDLPPISDLPDMEVGFFAILEMPNGGLKLEPIWVNL